MIIYDVLQHCYDERCNPESWSSLLTSTEVKGHFKGFNNPSKKVVLKDEIIAECLVVSSHFPTLKHEVEQQLLTCKWLFELLPETNKQLFLVCELL